MNLRFLPVFVLASGVVAAHADQPVVTAAVDEARHVVKVEIGGKLFTELLYAGQAKPVLYPVIGPGGLSMTRHWPLEDAAPGEETDHPHHKSLWFTHGSVNGIDFWMESDKAGKIIVQGTPETATENGEAVIRTKEQWQAPDGKPVCSSATVIRCGAEGADRYIDYTITISADGGDVVFGDTKEGSMGLRSNPVLNLKGAVARGGAENSEGQKGKDIWGKHARWVDYTAPVDGKVVGIACFDYPDNLRHPTTWHARDYGLIAANPFGLHDFEKKEKGAGDYTIKAGAGLTLRYRWLFHTGTTADAAIESRWKKWAGK